MGLLIAFAVVAIALRAWSAYQTASAKSDVPPPGTVDIARLPTLASRPIPVVFGEAWVSPQVLRYESWNENGSEYRGKQAPDDAADAGTRPSHRELRYHPDHNAMALMHHGLCLGRASILDVRVDGKRLSQHFYEPPEGRSEPSCLKISDGFLRITGATYSSTGAPVGPGFPGIHGEFRILTGVGTDAFKEKWKWEEADELPDFRGITSLISCESSFPPDEPDAVNPDADFMYLAGLGGAAWLGNDPNPPALQYHMRRAEWGWDGEEQWLKGYARVWGPSGIGEWRGMNPVHIIRELIVSKIYGLGEPDECVDEVSFQAVAIKLWEEMHGLNFGWESQAPVKELINAIEQHIGGIVWFDAAADAYKIRLLRDDYVLDDTRQVGPSEVSKVESFSQSSWEDLPNQITASFRDRYTSEEYKVTLTNTATQVTGGRVVGASVSYEYVTNRALAERLASRDLVQSGTPLASVTLRCKEIMRDVLPGDVVRWTWPDYGVENMALRVMRVNIGDGRDNSVTLHCVEDVFGTGRTIYFEPDEPQPGPDLTPQPSPHRYAFPAPYWLARRAGLPDPIAVWVPPGEGKEGEWVEQTYAVFLASSPMRAASRYHLDVSTDGGTTFDRWRDDVPFATRTTLRAPINQSDRTVTLNMTVDNSLLPRGTLLLLTDGDVIGDEFAVVVDVNVMAQTVRVERAVVDTVPRAWAADTAVWVVSTSSVVSTPVEVGKTLWARVRTITSAGVLPVDEATEDEFGPVEDFYRRAISPADLTIEDVSTLGPQSYPPEVLRGDLVVRWAHRHRLDSEGRPLLPPQRWPTVEDGARYVLTVADVDADATVYVIGIASPLTLNEVTVPASALVGVDRARVNVLAMRSPSDVDSWSLRYPVAEFGIV